MQDYGAVWFSLKELIFRKDLKLNRTPYALSGRSGHKNYPLFTYSSLEADFVPRPRNPRRTNGLQHVTKIGQTFIKTASIPSTTSDSSSAPTFCRVKLPRELDLRIPNYRRLIFVRSRNLRLFSPCLAVLLSSASHRISDIELASSKCHKTFDHNYTRCRTNPRRKPRCQPRERSS